MRPRDVFNSLEFVVDFMVDGLLQEARVRLQTRRDRRFVRSWQFIDDGMAGTRLRTGNREIA